MARAVNPKGAAFKAWLGREENAKFKSLSLEKQIEAYKSRPTPQGKTRKARPITEEQALKALVSGKVELERTRLEEELEEKLSKHEAELVKQLQAAMKLK